MTELTERKNKLLSNIKNLNRTIKEGFIVFQDENDKQIPKIFIEFPIAFIRTGEQI